MRTLSLSTKTYTSRDIEVLYKKTVPKNLSKFTAKHQCQGCQAEACNFIKKEPLAQVFSCESWKIFRNTFFTEYLRTTASAAHAIEALDMTENSSSQHFMYVSPNRSPKS